MPGRTLVAFASACLLLAPGCAGHPYRLDASSAATLVGSKFVQTTRPTLCPDDAQPTIIGLQGAERTPEWGCLLACPVDQEYVTDVTQTDDSWFLAPACQPVCSASEHRTSYLDFDHHAHCTPGAVTDAAQLAARARELRFQRSEQVEQERKSEILARKKAEDEARERDGRQRQYAAHLGMLEEQLQAMETGPVPWTFELVQTHFGFKGELDKLSAGMDLDPTVRDSLIARAAALLPKRLESETILGVERSQRGPATDRVMRIRSCQNDCAEPAFTCRRNCAGLPPGMCAVCSQVQAQCQDTCAQTTR